MMHIQQFKIVEVFEIVDKRGAKLYEKLSTISIALPCENLFLMKCAQSNPDHSVENDLDQNSI